MKKLIVIAALICLSLLGLVAAAQQPALRLEITGVNTTRFPEVAITANVYDALGQPVPALDTGHFMLQGDLAASCPIRDVENISDDNLAFSTVLVIDVSDSMAGAPLERAKAAARRYVESLRPGDSVALVAFASTVERVLDYTDDREAILAAIDGLELSGRTALYQAAFEGIQFGVESPDPRRTMILLSDGGEYGGLSSVTPEEVAAAAVVNGVPVYTIGLGFGADRSFLETIANATNADYYESPTPDELASIYENLGALLTSQYVLTLDCDLPADGTEYPLILSVQSGDDSATAQATLRAPVPVPVIQLTLPNAPIDTLTTIPFEVLADDPLQSVVITIDGEIAAEFTEPPFGLEIDPYAFTPGTHGFEIVATDEDGDSSSYLAEFEIADLPVQVIVSGLQAGQSLDGETAVEVTLISQTPVNQVEALLDGADFALLAQEPWIINLLPLQSAPGEHTLSISADTTGGQHGEISLNFSFSNAAYQTATALAPTATQTPSPTPNLTGTANAMAMTTIPLTTTAEALFAAMTGTSQANVAATGTAVIDASATFAVAQQATSDAAAQSANQATAAAGTQTQAAVSAAAQNASDQAATAAAQAADSTIQAAATQAAQQSQTAVVQAATAGAATALAATDSAVSTAQMATLEAQAQATATFETEASLEAGEQTAAAATSSAEILITATANARATSNAEVRAQLQMATRDALATSNAEARLSAQQTSAVRSTARVVQTATSEARATGTEVARETALFVSNATGTALADNIATTTAQAQITITRIALETAVAQQQQTIDAASTTTAQAQATATAGAEIAGTATAEALALTATAVFEQTVNARSTVAGIGQGTATAEAQQTLDTRLAAIGTTTAETTPEIEEVTEQPATRPSATIPPTLVPVEAQPQAADASSGGLLIALLVIVLLAILVALVVYARRRKRVTPRR
ncbi:MAG: VWA domain-containing protein [Anaerolineae bacterium]|nr:VWA domain-containing protein [Anaerolineae bacterium]